MFIGQNSENYATEEVFYADLIVGEVSEGRDLSQTWRSVSLSDDSSESGSGSDTPSHQHSEFIIGEADVNDNFLVDWESQSEDEGTPVSSPSAEGDFSSPNMAELIVGEAGDSDLDSPPQSSTSQSDRDIGDSSSCNKSTTDDENSDDANTRARDSLTCKSRSVQRGIGLTEIYSDACPGRRRCNNRVPVI